MEINYIIHFVLLQKSIFAFKTTLVAYARLTFRLFEVVLKEKYNIGNNRE